ncbi:ATP-binding cassette domain-containing protein [Enterococcus caccae]|uniref:ABC transporter domain-containing protein n=1 Tax=Enterococcus caccae ATCC BAA-1240 TaxID=1158612 RepID=R3W9K8_9ENTE|nr:ATP-binding cassette domain-containing protein [Enterococcus caccae]EOL44566.1 hypothetical protein UC7_02109 [Enterococcus caccae ATCC BAA-1240]EOT58709.1 hypothetical protein I580_02881 [Enterococcus caccae ATCC BAA-1240]OJG25945.1 hypothetical protein RU98_GL000822 [Enterococcus caccae]
MKYAHTIQNENSDCGVAVLETVLNQLDLKKIQLSKSLGEILKNKKYDEQGLSLYDIKVVLEKYGVSSDCYEVIDFEELRGQRAPQIITIKKSGLPHYCVIHAFKENTLVLSDPSEVNVFEKSIEEIKEDFSGYAVCIDEVSKVTKISKTRSYPEEVVYRSLREIPTKEKFLSISALLFSMFLPIIATYGLEYLSGKYVSTLTVSTISLIGCFVGVLIVIYFYLMRYNTRFKIELGNKIEQKVLTRFFESKLNDTTAKANLDNLTGYFWNCINATQGLLEKFYLIVHILFSIILVVLLAKYSFLLAANLLFWSIVFYVFIRPYIQKICLSYKGFIAHSNILSGTFEESIRTTLDINVFSKKTDTEKNFQFRLSDYFGTKLELGDTDTIISAIMEGTRILMMLTHFILYAYLFKTNHLDLLAGVASGIYVLYIATTGLNSLFGSYLSYEKSKEAIQYIETKNDFEEKEEQEIKNIEVECIRELRLTDICFSYEGNKVLQNQNYHFTSGNLYSIVGKNGVGKSTLIKLICGLIDNQEGEFIINMQTKLNSMKQTNILEHISYYSTEMDVYGQSIENNILFNVFNPKNKMDEPLNPEYFDQMNVEQTIDSLVTSSGRNISQGQKQKLLLLRTLNKEADIYIFDEPTGNLDQETKQSFMSIVQALVKDKKKIVLIITHDENIIEQADKTYTLKEGEASENG